MSLILRLILAACLLSLPASSDARYIHGTSTGGVSFAKTLVNVDPALQATSRSAPQSDMDAGIADAVTQ